MSDPLRGHKSGGEFEAKGVKVQRDSNGIWLTVGGEPVLLTPEDFASLVCAASFGSENAGRWFIALALVNS